MFVHPARFSSTGEWIRYFRNIMKNMDAGYCTGGCGSIPAAFCQVLLETGNSVKLGKRVQKITVNGDGGVRGVRCIDGEEYYASAVVSNAGIQATVLGLVENPSDHFSREA